MPSLGYSVSTTGGVVTFRRSALLEATPTSCFVPSRSKVPAARAGARAASVEAGDDAARAAALDAAAGLDPGRLTVTISRSGAQGDPVVVAVVYEAPVAGLISGWLLPPEVTLRASSTMRQEFG